MGSFCKIWSYIPLWKTYLYDLANPISFRTLKILVIMRIYFYFLGKVEVLDSERQRFKNRQRLENCWASIDAVILHRKYWPIALLKIQIGGGAQIIIPQLQTWKNPNSYVMFSAKSVMWEELCYWNFGTCVKYFQKPFRKGSSVIWSCLK